MHQALSRTWRHQGRHALWLCPEPENVITDAMEMGAITQQYNNADATVGCILAGVDIVLGPQNFPEAFDAVVNAVEKGIISEERINQSVRRILRLKIKQ